MADNLTAEQMHTLVCTNRKKERKDPRGSWETTQAVKRANLLRTIEQKQEQLQLLKELS